MDKDSRFMTDHSEGDKGKEAVMDFQLSWVLRMAADTDYTKDKPAFRLFSKYMLLKILGKPFPSSIQIASVKVWKEWENIDLCVEVELVKNGKKECHFILIENKVYTDLKEGQRDDYPKTLRQYYENSPDKKDYIPHQVLILCTESDSDFKKAKAFCKDTSWKVLSIYDIILDLNIETESELFNEFWIYNWKRLKN